MIDWLCGEAAAEPRKRAEHAESIIETVAGTIPNRDFVVELCLTEGTYEERITRAASTVGLRPTVARRRRYRERPLTELADALHQWVLGNRRHDG